MFISIRMELLLVFNLCQDFTVVCPPLTLHEESGSKPPPVLVSELVVASDMYRALQVLRNTYRKV